MPQHELDLPYQAQCRDAMNLEQAKSLSESDNWKHLDRPQVHADWDALYSALAALIDTSNPTDSHVQALIEQHHEIACRFYRPSREAYIGMALFYGENSDMKDFHNAYHPEMVTFLGRAICVYAQARL